MFVPHIASPSPQVTTASSLPAQQKAHEDETELEIGEEKEQAKPTVEEHTEDEDEDADDEAEIVGVERRATKQGVRVRGDKPTHDEESKQQDTVVSPRRPGTPPFARRHTFPLSIMPTILEGRKLKTTAEQYLTSTHSARELRQLHTMQTQFARLVERVGSSRRVGVSERDARDSARSREHERMRGEEQGGQHTHSAWLNFVDVMLKKSWDLRLQENSVLSP